jgi:hypothetical protein
MGYNRSYMNENELIAKIMERTGLPREKAAELVSLTTQTLQSDGHEHTVDARIAGEEPELATLARGEPVSDAVGVADAERAALAKAEAAFGQRRSADPADRAYSERSGLFV